MLLTDFYLEISDCHIISNRFNSNTAGIYLEGVSRAQIHENTFNNNGWGMKIQASCMDNVIGKRIQKQYLM